MGVAKCAVRGGIQTRRLNSAAHGGKLALSQEITEETARPAKAKWGAKRLESHENPPARLKPR